MEEEVRRKRREVMVVRELGERVRAVLGGDGGINGSSTEGNEESDTTRLAGRDRKGDERRDGDGDGDEDGDRERERERRTWAALEEIDVG